MDSAAAAPDIERRKAQQGERIAPHDGNPVGRNRIVHVVVLYVHPLLGEGLARLLSAQDGLRAVAVSNDNQAARAAALRKRPDLVIVEETGEGHDLESRGSLPVVFVRLDVEDGERLGQPLADPDLIIALARGLADLPVEHAELIGAGSAGRFSGRSTGT